MQAPELVKNFEKFPKLSEKQFFKLYKDSMKVIEGNYDKINSPELMFQRILDISNKNVHINLEEPTLKSPRSLPRYSTKLSKLSHLKSAAKDTKDAKDKEKITDLPSRSVSRSEKNSPRKTAKPKVESSELKNSKFGGETATE